MDKSNRSYTGHLQVVDIIEFQMDIHCPWVIVVKSIKILLQGIPFILSNHLAADMWTTNAPRSRFPAVLVETLEWFHGWTSYVKTDLLSSCFNRNIGTLNRNQYQYQILWECCEAHMNSYTTRQVKTTRPRSARLEAANLGWHQWYQIPSGELT